MKLIKLFTLILLIGSFTSCTETEDPVTIQGTWELQNVDFNGTHCNTFPTGEKLKLEFIGIADEIDQSWTFTESTISIQGPITVSFSLVTGEPINIEDDLIMADFQSDFTLNEDQIIVSDNPIDQVFVINELTENTLKVTNDSTREMDLNGNTITNETEVIYSFTR